MQRLKVDGVEVNIEERYVWNQTVPAIYEEKKVVPPKVFIPERVDEILGLVNGRSDKGTPWVFRLEHFARMYYPDEKQLELSGYYQLKNHGEIPDTYGVLPARVRLVQLYPESVGFQLINSGDFHRMGRKAFEELYVLEEHLSRDK